MLEHGSASIKDLAELFGVSLITIHRDLDELERQGVLRKLRGYVTAQPSSLFESNVRYRLRVATREKEALARFAVTLVEPGQAVLLDDSTTTLAVAKLLPDKAPLTVITNFVMIMNELSGVKDIELISLGGKYRPFLAAFGGEICQASLSAIRADILFLSTSAISDGAALHQDGRTMQGKRAMMASAKRRILLVDHTKFGKVAFHKLSPLQDFDLVVVDSGISEAHLDELRERSVPFEVVPL
ncbi:MAG: DeoR/GlpR family DNA-binding transcription regulator [Rubrobacteraceae bacterium]|nr:DeoR/GlpR family DNA-binding transcription regulator [Rubrobacteraceae bacterium]